MGNLYEHAKSELDRIYTPDSLAEDDGDGQNKWIYDAILELIRVFGEQGLSGLSAPYVTSCLTKLMKWEPLTPLTFEEAEWSEDNQNKRMSSVFRNDNGRYYLYAITFREENGSTFTGSVKLEDGTDVTSRQFIKPGIEFPHKNKTHIVDVTSRRYAKVDDELIPDENGDWWEHTIKDESQLDEVWKYYEKC